jgi:hypothetical protein
VSERERTLGATFKAQILTMAHNERSEMISIDFARCEQRKDVDKVLLMKLAVIINSR